MIKEAYLVVLCGCEGLEKLVYLTDDKDDAINKMKSLKEDILKAQAHKEQVDKDAGILTDEDLYKYEKEHGYESPWDKLHSDEKITWEEWENGSMINVDDYCVRRWDGTKFKCVCKELGVPPSKPMLY